MQRLRSVIRRSDKRQLGTRIKENRTDIKKKKKKNWERCGLFPSTELTNNTSLIGKMSESWTENSHTEKDYQMLNIKGQEEKKLISRVTHNFSRIIIWTLKIFLQSKYQSQKDISTYLLLPFEAIIYKSSWHCVKTI